MSKDPFELVSLYQRNLSDRIIGYLHDRGISDEIIAHHHVGWNGQRITIPIFDRDGRFAFFKLAKDPDDRADAPKMLTSRGGTVELYGWERVLERPLRLIVCEGEFDRLVLETCGFPAVTPTGGASSFRREWLEDLAVIDEVFVCFDRDEAGRAGAVRVGELLPEARIVELPEEVGVGGDVSDYLVRLGRSREDFLVLLERARPVPAPPATLPVVETNARRTPGALTNRIALVKESVPIAGVVRRYVGLRESGQGLRGLCPFHDDHTPSLMVYPDAANFRCYGCGQHGDVIDFLQTMEKLSFLGTLDALEGFESAEYGDSNQWP